MDVVKNSRIAAWIIAAVLLLFVLAVHLLPALLAGLLVYELVHIIAPSIRLKQIHGSKAKIIVVALLAIVIIGILTA